MRAGQGGPEQQSRHLRRRQRERDRQRAAQQFFARYRTRAVAGLD